MLKCQNGTSGTTRETAPTSAVARANERWNVRSANLAEDERRNYPTQQQQLHMFDQTPPPPPPPPPEWD